MTAWARGELAGLRLRVLDWRDGSSVNGTLVGFRAKLGARRLLVGPAARLLESYRLLAGGGRAQIVNEAASGAVHGRPPYGSLHGLSLCVQRDFAAGTRDFSPEEVLDVSDTTTRERARNVKGLLEANALADARPVESFLNPGHTFTPKGCAGCLAYVEDPRQLFAVHGGGPLGQTALNCIGLALIPEMALLLEQLGVDVFAEPSP